jgi:Flp pilus assembly protein TadD
MKALNASAALLLSSMALLASAQPRSGVAASVPAASSTATVSAMDGQTFFQLLIAELNAQGADPGAAYSLMLDVARRTNEEAAYKRAIEMALQARAGDPALQAAKAWAQAIPSSREAHSQVFNILLALNRVPETAEPAAALWKLATPADRETAAFDLVRAFARASDKTAARAAFDKAFERELAAKPSGASNTNAAAQDVLLASRARLQAAAREFDAASTSLQAAFAVNGKSLSAAFAAIELVDPARPQAAASVERYLAQSDVPRRADVRLAFARALAADRAYAQSLVHTSVAVQEPNAAAEVWMLHAYMLQRAGNARAAEAAAAFERVIALDAAAPNPPAGRSQQAQLQIAELAIAQKQWQLAEAAIAKIDANTTPLQLTVASLRARSLAGRGQWREGRAAFAAVRVANAPEARQRFAAEVRYLRTIKRDAEAYAMMAERRTSFGTDPDLTYEHAVLAERVGKHDEMEALMREVIAARPTDATAYNALGYAFADRNVRLDEARSLINKALELQPGDAAITDSLGWLEYRLGNFDAALKHLEAAYASNQDAEIAAHLGEVLWQRGQRERALVVLRKGLADADDNDVLRATIKRLGVDVSAKP